MEASLFVGSQNREPRRSILSLCPHGDSFLGNGSDFPAKFSLLSHFQLDLVGPQEPGSPGPPIGVWLPGKLGAAAQWPAPSLTLVCWSEL